MKKPPVTHTTIRNENLFCLNCGGSFQISYPIQPQILSDKITAFNDLHAKCPPTWKEPEADQEQSTKQKAMWWISNGETGMSSKTMWNCFMGTKSFSINHPYDPDDFRRCYKLLHAVPEWKKLIPKLKELSPAWSNLAENWDKLTEMYEENERTKWKKHKEIDMYGFMQKLIN